MKPPDHPVPSGDRTMARSLLQAFDAAGVEVTLASRLVSRDGTGDARRQADLQNAANAEIDRLIGAGGTPRYRAWITYHNYYKAPDLIGPAVARAQGIPYLQIESTRAKKRHTGPWSAFGRAADAASDAAAVIFHLTERDAEALRRDAPTAQRLVGLPAFLPQDKLPRKAEGGAGLLCVGMMRPGDKLASYRLVAEALALLTSPSWRLTLVGDGPARPDVEAMMRPFGTRVRFTGALSAEGVDSAYRDADVLFWPGVGEAFGMVYLEAQARGLPVVAQDRPGVRDVLAPGAVACAVRDGAPALARALDRLLDDASQRETAEALARDHIAAHHLLPGAARVLEQTLKEVCR